MNGKRYMERYDQVGLILKATGGVRYDAVVTEARIMGLSVVEYAQNGVADDIRRLWDNVRASLNSTDNEG